MNRLDMSKVKEILRLKSLGFSYRDIAASCECGKSVVGETIKRAKAAGIADSACNISETELEKMLFPEKYQDADNLDMSYILSELSRKHVTRQLLWEEYKIENPDGLMYSQFCERIRSALKADEMDYRKTHKAGQTCEVDWAGSTIPYFDKDLKVQREAAIFVACLPASAYPFAYAYKNQKTASWIDGHLRAFRFFGGTPRILVPDNTKTAVISTDLFDPVISKTYMEMAHHYDMCVVPTRSGKPRDKNYVENTVGNVSRRIIAALRDEHFTSIEQVNEAIAQKLEVFIDKPFQKREGSRRSAFASTDAKVLRPLPKNPYELAHFASAKIGINYHVEYEKFFYSVPFEYRGRACSIRATSKTIEVFAAGERICSHMRKYSGNRYLTDPDHLPDQHKVVSEWNDKRFLRWAKKYGDNTHLLIEALLGRAEYSVQAYRSCMGILQRAKSFDPKIVEAASTMALETGHLSGKYFALALKQKSQEMQECSEARPIAHSNIRGAGAFVGAGRDA